MSIPEPPALSRGVEGAARLPDGPRLGTLTTWRLVLSPTTGRRTLIAEGRFLRYYAGAGVRRAAVEVTPTTPPARVGRPKPRPARPFALVGEVKEFNTHTLVVAEDAP